MWNEVSLSCQPCQSKSPRMHFKPFPSFLLLVRKKKKGKGKRKNSNPNPCPKCQKFPKAQPGPKLGDRKSIQVSQLSGKDTTLSHPPLHSQIWVRGKQELGAPAGSPGHQNLGLRCPLSPNIGLMDH